MVIEEYFEVRYVRRPSVVAVVVVQDQYEG